MVIILKVLLLKGWCHCKIMGYGRSLCFLFLQIVFSSLIVLVQFSHCSPLFDDIYNALNFVTSLALKVARMAPDMANFAPHLLQQLDKRCHHCHWMTHVREETLHGFQKIPPELLDGCSLSPNRSEHRRG